MILEIVVLVAALFILLPKLYYLAVALTCGAAYGMTFYYAMDFIVRRFS